MAFIIFLTNKRTMASGHPATIQPSGNMKRFSCTAQAILQYHISPPGSDKMKTLRYPFNDVKRKPVTGRNVCRRLVTTNLSTLRYVLHKIMTRSVEYNYMWQNQLYLCGNTVVQYTFLCSVYE